MGQHQRYHGRHRRSCNEPLHCHARHDDGHVNNRPHRDERRHSNSFGILCLEQVLHDLRCYQARTQELIPLFGAFGLANQLGVQDYGRERKFRERVRRWLELVKLYWPECPATVSANGQHLELAPAAALIRVRGELREMRSVQRTNAEERCL